jgi:hypothetical protein
MAERTIALGYAYDQQLHEKINRSGMNYWDIYIKEINEQLGLRGEELSLGRLEDKDCLSKITTLIIGRQTGRELSAVAKAHLRTWVIEGGTLIGFGLEGLDELFGIQTSSRLAESPNPYAVSGYFQFVPHRLTQDIHSPLSPKQKLLILSDIQLVRSNGGTEIGHLYDQEEKDSGFPAILWHSYGRGHTGYFAFDAAKTIWLLHQGRPYTKGLDQDENIYFGNLRLAGIGRDNAGEVLYTDEILFLLQNMIAQHPHPFVYPIPPKAKEIPEALLYWSGDGCGGPGSEGLHAASNFMKGKGLPYNIHVLSKGCSYDLTIDDAQAITNNGHELSIEYYFCYRTRDNFDLEITDEASLAGRYEVFQHTYGIPVISTGCHGGYYSEKWGGWIEDMKWKMRCGGKADNTFMGEVPDHIDSNSPRLSFGHGTAYPYYFYDDFRGGNQRIDFIEEPLTAYELGRRGQKGDPDESVPPHEVHPAIDMAVKYHLTLNMFYHAVNIARGSSTRAIEEVLRYIAEKNASIVHMGTDELWRWWDARSRSHVGAVRITKDHLLSFHVDCQYDAGMIVKTALPDAGKVTPRCDMQPAPHEIKREFGNHWLYLVVPPGKHQIDIITEVGK